MEGQDSQMSQSLISDGEEVAEIEDVLNDEFEINSNGKAVKKKRKDGPRKADMTSEENALILNWMEFRYKELYGRGQSSSVADDKKQAWEEFTDALNALHDRQFKRTRAELEKRINNMKKMGKLHHHIGTQSIILMPFEIRSRGGFKHFSSVLDSTLEKCLT